MLSEIYAREKLRDVEAEGSRQLRYTPIIAGSPLMANRLLRATGSVLTRLGQRLESWASQPALNPVPAATTRPASGYAAHAHRKGR